MLCDGLQSRTPEELALLLATDEYQETVSTTPFLYLTLDLPNVPLFSVSVTTHPHTLIAIMPGANSLRTKIVSYGWKAEEARQAR